MSEIITILGKKGHGKTTYMNFLLNENQLRPKIIIDLFNQYPKIQPLYFDAIDFLSHIQDSNYELRNKKYRLSIFDKIDFDSICRFIINVKNIQFYIDEVDFFDSPVSSVKSFIKLIHYSRHYGVDIITTSRRPQRISRDLTSQTDTFIFFKVTEKRDLDYIENLSSDLADAVKNLKPFEYIKYTYDDDLTVSKLNLAKA